MAFSWKNSLGPKWKHGEPCNVRRVYIAASKGKDWRPTDSLLSALDLLYEMIGKFRILQMKNIQSRISVFEGAK